MISEVIYIEYLSCLLEGDKSKCMAIVAHLLEQNLDIKELYTKLFQRSLQRVGKLCEMNRICIATEHMATSITENLMNFTYSMVPSVKKTPRKAVVSCVPKEFHQVGAKMVSDILELNGWNSYFLGANTPPGELFKLLDEKKPELLALSIGTYFNVVRLVELLEKVREKYPEINIIVGGQAFEKGSEDIIDRFNNVKYISTLSELEKYILSYDAARITNMVK